MPRSARQLHFARRSSAAIVTLAATAVGAATLTLALAGPADAAPTATPSVETPAAPATAATRPQISAVPAPVPDISTLSPRISVPAGNAYSTSPSHSSAAGTAAAGLAAAGGLLLAGGATVAIRRRA